MNLLNDLSRGAMIISIFALVQNGCSVKEMANRAAKAHQEGLTKYGAYSRMLTESDESWTDN